MRPILAILAVATLAFPSVGTTRCEQKQVWSEARKRYLWREICE